MTERVLSRWMAEQLVRDAAAAPSMHNSQPWRFVARPAGRAIEIYADPARARQHADPHGRAVHLACGAALFNLRLAIACRGAEPVARILPDPRDPLLLACVRLGGHHRAGPAERGLHQAIGSQGGRLSPHPGGRIPAGILAGLAEAAALEGASLRIPAEAEVQRTLRLSATAGHPCRDGPGDLAELDGWGGVTRCWPGCVAAGHTGPGRVAGLGPPPHAVTVAGPRPSHRARTVRWPSPRLLALCTPGDDRASWLRAGQAMQRVLLLAAHRGLRAWPLIPVLAAPGAPPDGSACAGQYPQLALLMDWAAPGVPAPRRPAGEILRVISPLQPVPAAAGRDESPRAAPPHALAGR